MPLNKDTKPKNVMLTKSNEQINNCNCKKIVRLEIISLPFLATLCVLVYML